MTNDETNDENNGIESKMDEDGNEMENNENNDQHISFSSTSEFTSRLDLKLQVMIFRENKV